MSTVPEFVKEGSIIKLNLKTGNIWARGRKYKVNFVGTRRDFEKGSEVEGDTSVDQDEVLYQFVNPKCDFIGMLYTEAEYGKLWKAFEV